MRRLVALLLVAVLATASRAAEVAVRAVDAVGLTVASLERSLEFYTQVLPFEKVADFEAEGDAADRLRGVFALRLRGARLRLGSEVIELTEYLTPRGRPVPADSRSNDRWFQHLAIVVRDMAAAYAVLHDRHVEHVSPSPQRLPDWNPNAGGIEAFYFKDPDGHVLELIRFPPGKGDPRWQRPGGALFLGIDHTAIVVADTDASLRFYRDLLGLRVAGTSENWGPEQERLNAVFGARLRITGLRAEAGPGVELLEYLTPRDGRPYPPDAKANDLANWVTRVSAPGLDAVVKPRVALVSPGVVALPERPLGFGRGVGVRDPDGHALEVVSE